MGICRTRHARAPPVLFPRLWASNSRPLTTIRRLTHSRASILSIGDEITLGQSLDTNSQWLAQRLVEAGITPIEHATVPDDLGAHTRVLRDLASRSDLILSSGGLGPTLDDLTREAVARASGDVLVEDPEALAQIEAWFAKAGRTMNPLNRAQALRPSRGRLLRNDHGTAPGLHAVISKPGAKDMWVDAFCLPGPPHEMRAMFERAVRPMLRPPPGRIVRTLVLPSIGLGESDIAQRLGELMDRDRDVMVGTTASKGVVSVRVRFEGPPEDADARVREAESLVRARIGDVIFVHGDVPLAAEVLALLRESEGTLATVESCTGGLLGGMLTDIPGSSDVYLGGFVTYSNTQKTAMVGVDSSMFEPTGPGAVSARCASAMAVGGLERTGASMCLAITGVAGPGGGSNAKPVGTVWIALAMRDQDRGVTHDARRFSFAGDRSNIREWAGVSALALARARLVGSQHRPLLREQERAAF